MRGEALAEIVDLERAADVDRLTFRPPPGVAIEPDTSIRPHLYDGRLILEALDRRKLNAAAVSPAPERERAVVGGTLARLLGVG